MRSLQAIATRTRAASARDSLDARLTVLERVERSTTENDSEPSVDSGCSTDY